MKIFRSHIARLTVALFVGLGFSLYMVQPAQAEYTSDAFASWLSSMSNVPDSEKADLQKELQDLRQSEEHLDKLIEKASEIIIQNNKKFDFHFSDSEAYQQVYQLLLIEWNQHQTGNAMAGLPVKQTVKSLALLKIDSPQILDLVPLGFGNSLKSPGPRPHIFENQVQSSVAVIPMDENIAIGAP